MFDKCKGKNKQDEPCKLPALEGGFCHLHDKKSKKCGAKSRKNEGRPCRNRSMANGRCRMHGGKSTGAPPEKLKGNKNRLTHGIYETIWLDALEEDETKLLDKIDLSVIAQIDEELKLVTIRERRMLLRINNLQKNNFTIVSKEFEGGFGPQGPINRESEKQEATLGQIQRIEEALTKVQEKKVRLLDLKHKVTSGQGPDKPDVTQFMDALNSTADVWSEEEDGE